MPTVHEQLTEQFYRWEKRGRGWRIHSEPVSPEPPFVPFHGHHLPATPVVDDGRRPTFLSSLFKKVAGVQEAAAVTPETEEEPEPDLLSRDELVELQLSLSTDADPSRESFDQFLSNLSLCHEPLSFEILGGAKRVTVQCAASPGDASKIGQQVQAHFPDVFTAPRKDTLRNAWESSGRESFVLEFGLKNAFMLPLALGKLDPFVGIIGALAHLGEGDLGLFQVLFQPVREAWAESIQSSVSHGDGKPFFVNAPELTQGAENKIAKRLYAAVIRVAARGRTYDRAFEIARDLACALTVFAHPQGNELIPLSNEGYDIDDHIEDTLSRQTRRSGMILNADELIGFVHLPSKAVRSPALVRESGKTKAAPEAISGLFIGNNVHLEKEIPVRITPEQRVRHTHILGASGTGKSTLLFNSICQDIENGEGVAVLDPHGDLIEKVLAAIPPERIKDVVLVDPSDERYAIPFNILNAHSELEKTLLASDLTAVFQRLSSSWGDQMQSVLQNAILAFLESTRGGTLADLRRFLIEPAFRNDFLKTVRDPNVLYYWQKGVVHLSGNKSIGPVLTRLEMFLSKKPILHMVAQPENRLDFGEIMDLGKIFLAKLPEGLLGKENSYLLGALLISKFQQLAMSRQAMQIEARRDFWIYLDEFHNFITPSMAEILSGARKYRMGLTLAHHELRQLQRDAEVASAVLSHPCTRICFRLGDEDARKMADGFSFFEARDLQNLGVGQAIARIERSDFDFNLTVPLPAPIDQASAAERRSAIIEASRQKYGTRRSVVEATLLQSWTTETSVKPTVQKLVPQKESAQPSPPAVAQSPIPEKPTVEPPAVTDSEKKIVEPPKPAADVATPPVPLPRPEKSKTEDSDEQGRGGNLHVTLQKRFQTEAWKLGFKAEIEAPVKRGSGKAADLIISLEDITIAVEVPVEGSFSDEFGNIKKCLEVGFARVAVVSLRSKLLKQLSEAVAAAFDSEIAAKVSYHSPEEFLAELHKIAGEIAAKPKQPPKPHTEKVGNYEVEAEYPTLTPEEIKEREEARIRLIAETMRKKNRGKLGN